MIVAVDSDYEDVTAACFEYRKDNLFPEWERQGIAVTRLNGQGARRNAVAQELGGATTRYLTGSGHVFDDYFTGDQQQPVLKVGEYAAAEVRGRIVHLLSCSTAEQLGPDLVANGCLAFFGYDVEFLFPLE